MNRLKNNLSFLTLLMFVACSPSKSQERTVESENSLSFNILFDGRDTTGSVFLNIYEIRPPRITTVGRNEKTNLALRKSHQYLTKKKKTVYQVGNLTVSDAQLLQTTELLQSLPTEDFSGFLEKVEAHQMQGADNLGNVHFTGYYIPQLSVREVADSVYKYPLYRKPMNWGGIMPSRKAIDEQNALAGQGLELCYSSSLFDNFVMQVQGSGVVQYADGRQELLSYAGQNGHGYQSIGKYLVNAGYIAPEEISLDAIKNWCVDNPDSLSTLLNRNPSYVFFTKVGQEPYGSAGVPLVEQASVAVDKRYIPLGSTLLAAIPVLDGNNQFIGHEYRILTALDTGGAIKGAGRMDFFCGVGEVGRLRADALNHYGKVWILLPKIVETE